MSSAFISTVIDRVLRLLSPTYGARTNAARALHEIVSATDRTARSTAQHGLTEAA